MKLYIKILIYIFALSSSSMAFADATSERVVERLSQRLSSSSSSYSVEFSTSIPDLMPSTEGVFIISGKSYYINISEVEVFFNGSVRETYNSLNNELVVENNVPEDESILVNPTKILSLNSNNFIHRTLDINIEGVDVVELTPKSNEYGPLTLYVDRTSGLPTKITTQIEEAGPTAIFEIKRIEFDIEVEQSSFSFDRSKYEDAEIINF